MMKDLFNLLKIFLYFNERTIQRNPSSHEHNLIDLICLRMDDAMMKLLEALCTSIERISLHGGKLRTNREPLSAEIAFELLAGGYQHFIHG